jgi:hypothetical protein
LLGRCASSFARLTNSLHAGYWVVVAATNQGSAFWAPRLFHGVRAFANGVSVAVGTLVPSEIHYSTGRIGELHEGNTLVVHHSRQKAVSQGGRIREERIEPTRRSGRGQKSRVHAKIVEQTLSCVRNSVGMEILTTEAATDQINVQVHRDSAVGARLARGEVLAHPLHQVFDYFRGHRQTRPAIFGFYFGNDGANILYPPIQI